MYVPESFRISDFQTLADLLERHAFAALVTNTSEGLVASHVPLLLERGSRDAIVGHLARANSQWRQFDGRSEALAIFQGPHAYVSPSWYASAPAVPTWNYAAVHVYGRPRLIEDIERVQSILYRLVARYEGDRATPWDPESLPADFKDRVLKAIVAFEMPIERIEGKFKLGQNRSPEDRMGTIQGLLEEGGAYGSELAELTLAMTGRNTRP